MKKLIILGFLSMSCVLKTTSQTRISIKGKVVASISEKPLKGVSVLIVDTSFSAESNFNGTFKIENIPVGSYEIQFQLTGYVSQKILVNILENEIVDLRTVFLSRITPEIQETSIISLTDDDLLNDGERSSDYIAGLFQSSN